MLLNQGFQKLLLKIFRALLRVIRCNCCKQCMRSKDFSSLIVTYIKIIVNYAYVI